MRALIAALALVVVLLGPPVAAQEQAKPNILVIFGDDIGQTNVSAYSFGLMGYRTPNIDRIAREGTMFTDYYAEQSCTAGRSSFITGQATLRTGLSKVGLPAATSGCRPRTSPSPRRSSRLGYATGQFGKNHLGDRNEFLPTVHGFDEFFGNLYHLNAEEEPENPDYPKDPAFKARFGPRGVIRSVATDTRRPDRRPALRQGRPADDRGHRPVDQEADGDDRRRDHQRGDRLHRAAGQGQQAVLRLDELDPDAPLHACAAVDARPERHQRVFRRDDRA